MSNLTQEQIENLERDGYIIEERGGKTGIVKELSNGAVRYNMENGEVKRLDSYFGDVRDRDNHDRVSQDLETGKLSGHGFNHEKRWL